MARLFTIESAGPGELRRWELVWLATDNVAAAWRCYRLARAWNLPVPPSVLSELDRIAAAIEAEVNGVKARSEGAGLRRQTLTRLVTRRGRGSNDPAADLIRWERDFALTSAVAVLRLGGLTRDKAFERVAVGTRGLALGLLFNGDSVTMAVVDTPGVTVDVVRIAVRRVNRLLTDATDGA